MKKSEYNAVDVMRFVLAMLVIAVHTHPLEHFTNQFVLNVYNLFLWRIVPLFFLATGFFIGIAEKSGRQGVIHSKLISTVVQYLIWSIIYLPLAFWDYMTDEYNYVWNIGMYIRGLLCLGEHYNSWQLWYLLAIIYVLFFLLLLSRVNIKENVRNATVIIVGIVLVLAINNINAFEGDNVWLYWMRQVIRYTYVSSRLFTGMIYVPIGIIVARKGLKLKSSMGLFLFGLLTTQFLSVYSQNGLELIWPFFMELGLFGIIININLENNPIYRYLRTISVVMFFTHMWVLTIYYAFVKHGDRYGMDSFLVTTIVSMLLGSIYYFYKFKYKEKSNYVQKS